MDFYSFNNNIKSISFFNILRSKTLTHFSLLIHIKYILLFYITFCKWIKIFFNLLLCMCLINLLYHNILKIQIYLLTLLLQTKTKFFRWLWFLINTIILLLNYLLLNINYTILFIIIWFDSIISILPYYFMIYLSKFLKDLLWNSYHIHP